FRSSYNLEYFESGGTYLHPFAKLYDRTTTVVENLERPFKRGVWIDIFPLDGTFQNYWLRFLHVSAINVLVGAFSLNLGRYPHKHNRALRRWLRSILTPCARAVSIRIWSSLL